MELKRHQNLVLAVTVILLAAWTPAVFTPYWQEDFEFLMEARSAARAGLPWTVGFTTPAGSCFWRPMSTGIYWRLIDALGGSPIAAHAISLLLVMAATAAVGWFAADFVRLRFPRIDAVAAGVWAALFYGVNNALFLPIHWACGVQDLLMMLFSALFLRFWILAISADGCREVTALIASLTFAVAALFCKETAVVLPALAAVLAVWLHPNFRPTSRMWIAGILLAAVTAGWWIVHQRMTVSPPVEYRMQFGLNTLRNGVCLVLFLFNLPRESLRFVLEREPLAAVAAVWGLFCFSSCVAAWFFLIRALRKKIAVRDVVCTVGAVAVGLSPHLLLGWNCYEYYTLMALPAAAVLVGVAMCKKGAARWAFPLLIVSSLAALAGNYLLPQPALLARARWANRQLTLIRDMRDAEPQKFQPPIYLRVENERQFHAFDVAGLAYTLDMRPSDFAKFSPKAKPAKSSPIIVVPATGDVHWERD